MRPDEFAHVIAAAAKVTGLDDFVVIGSQAIIGSHSHPPAALVVSMEADIYPQAAPEKADLIDDALGDGSAFHAAFRSGPAPVRWWWVSAQGFGVAGGGPRNTTPCASAAVRRRCMSGWPAGGRVLDKAGSPPSR